MTQITRIASAAAICMAVLLGTSCVDDLQEQGGMPEFVTGFTLTSEDLDFSELIEPGTKVSYDASLKFSFTIGDRLGIFPIGGEQVAFPLSTLGSDGSAKFDGGAWALRSSYDYAAYYPQNPDKHDTQDMTIPVSFKTQHQTGNNSTDGLGPDAFLFSKASKPDSKGNVTIGMKQCAGVVRLAATLPKGVTVSKVVLKDLTKALKVSGNVNLKTYSTSTKEYPTISSAKTGIVTVNIEGLTTGSGKDNLIVFLWLPPQDLSGHELQMEVMASDGSSYVLTTTPAALNLTAGKAKGVNFGEAAASLRPQLKDMITMVDNAAAFKEVIPALNYLISEKGYLPPDSPNEVLFLSDESRSLYNQYNFNVKDAEEDILGTIAYAGLSDPSDPFQLRFYADRMLPSSSYVSDVMSMVTMLSNKYAAGSTTESYEVYGLDGYMTKENWEYFLKSGFDEFDGYECVYTVVVDGVPHRLSFSVQGGRHVMYEVILCLPRPSFTLPSGKKFEYYTYTWTDCVWGESPDYFETGGEAPRSLTKEEWEYILTGRPNAARSWARGTKDGENCIFILPDGLYPDDFFNTVGEASRWTDNGIGVADLYSYRIICLPCMGYKKNGTLYGEYGGFYWTSSENEWGTPYYLTFDKDLGPRITSNAINFPKETQMGLVLFLDRPAK